VAPDDPANVIGGAGVQLRRVLPFPEGAGVAEGRQAIVINVYTEPAWRRRGVARSLMEAILTWARAADLESLVLHASAEGRGLYQQLGFVDTNEMRLTRGS
jgi:GNAT superfamily N-acetyltransferase